MKTLSASSKITLSPDTSLGPDSSAPPSTTSPSVMSATDESSVKGPLYRDPWCPMWTRWTNVLHTAIRKFVVAMADHAARHPVTYAVCLTVIPLAVLAVGFFTNFNVQVDYDVLYAPAGSKTKEQMNWVLHEAGFPAGTQTFTLLLHAQGDNVVGKQGVDQMLQAVEVLQNTKGYAELCSQSPYVVEYPNGTKMVNACSGMGVTRYWYWDKELFHKQVKTDQQVMKAISKKTFPDGVPVMYDFILGQSEWTNQTIDSSPALQDIVAGRSEETITSAKSLMEIFFIPDVAGAKDFELAAVKNLRALQQQWREAATIEARDGLEYHTMQLEVFTFLSYSTEFQRAIFEDIPLVFIVGIIVIGFTCSVFFKWDRVQSRSLLGIMTVHSITMSMAMTNGLLFIIGVPFTNMNMMLPFILYGVGLDDTFVIMGSYQRTDPKKDTVVRINESMEECGSSISLTTITTMVAFGISYGSSIPAIKWLCLYAFLSFGFIFVFQNTLFVAFIVLDERRVKANRMDLCCCIAAAPKEKPSGSDASTDGEPQHDDDQEDATHPLEDATLMFMSHYADFLMRPFVKVAVLVGFLSYMGFCVYRTTLLKQQFIVTELLPKDSYVSDFINAMDVYAADLTEIGIYFRDIDQSDPQVQQQMRDYIADLVNLEQLDGPPPFCWVTDFGNETDQLVSEQLGIDISQLSFNQKLDLAMSDPRIKQVYGEDIVRDEEGNIKASRCSIYLRNMDFNKVQAQIDMLNDQSAASAVQPVNQGANRWKMFTFADMYFLWEFYRQAVQELISTTIAGVVAVTLVAFILMPHYSAAAFVCPLIIMLYIDMLGTLQLAGLYINAVTYVCLTVSIGLLVDFLMHLLLRYYESKEVTREAKVKDTLKAMGVSVLVGGLSTFFAVIPLAFSTSAVIKTVFTSFFSLVSLGLAHGLILLPVVLSIVGPTMTPRLHKVKDDSRVDCDNSVASLSQNSGHTPNCMLVEPWDPWDRITLVEV